ncbi:Bloom syndrome protein, partial [Clarias magur]
MMKMAERSVPRLCVRKRRDRKGRRGRTLYYPEGGVTGRDGEISIGCARAE